VRQRDLLRAAALAAPRAHARGRKRHGAVDAGKARALERLMILSYVQGAEVIAEGIEDDADLEHVTAQGIEFGQGFLLGRPEPMALAQTARSRATRRGAGGGRGAD